jgi:hypothetical protein
MATTNDQEPVEGTVVRDRIWGGTHTGTVVRRVGRSVFVAWHHSFVEDELDTDQVEVWADAPEEPRQWRGGIGVIDPDGTTQIRDISEAQ